MYRFLLIITVGILLFMTAGCNPDDDENAEPDYRLAVPPAEVTMPEEDSDPAPPPDLTGFEAALEADPDDTSARFSYMTGLMRSGRIDESLEQARILAVAEGDNPFRSIASLNFANMVLDEVPDDDPEREDLLSEAMDLMWTALGWEPESIPGHLAYGRLALETGDNEKALHHLSIALTVMEIGYELRINMAEIFIEREDFEKAGAHLEVAGELAEEAEDSEAMSLILELKSALNM